MPSVPLLVLAVFTDTTTEAEASDEGLALVILPVGGGGGGGSDDDTTVSVVADVGAVPAVVVKLRTVLVSVCWC
jgi:hypothetical protein